MLQLNDAHTVRKPLVRQKAYVSIFVVLISVNLVAVVLWLERAIW